MRHRSLLASLVLVPAALVIGCGIEAPPKYGIASTEQALSTPLSEMPQNGYPPEGLDVNYALLSTIWKYPLNTTGITTTLGTVAPKGDGTSVRISDLFNQVDLTDPSHRLLPTSAEYLMDEIVSCALDWGHDVSYPVGATMRPSKGKFGLCEAGPPLESWQTSGASPQCRFMVSACILARMNALHKQVPISIRVPEQIAGEGSDFRLVDKVRVQPILRNGELPAPDWQPDFVGICKRGTTVKFRRSPAAMERAVRVCTGIHACNTSQQEPIVLRSPRIYSGFLNTDEVAGTISFTCPTNAATAPNGRPDYAYFSILTSPPGLAEPPSLEPMLVLVSTLTTTTYPAAEPEVFTYVEGAFYGNILPDPIGQGVKSVNFDRNACYSAIWKEGKMYEAGRICADPAHSDRCSVRSSPCDQDSGGRNEMEDQAFYGFARVWWWYGVTVFLNDPNAILHDPNAIPNNPNGILDPILKATAIQSVHDLCTPGASLAKNGPDVVVTRVCGVDPYCCSAAWDSRCISEVRTVANSPACGAVPCSHPACTTGDKLANGCSPIVTSVCAVDPFCCDTDWDNTCVQEVQTVAHSPACACSHPICTRGAALANGCSAVVTSVCAVDPFCCNTDWDNKCIEEVHTIAHSPPCPCSHPVCIPGTALISGCSPVVTSVCAADPYCCNTAWDNTCVQEVQTVAHSLECVPH